MPMAAFLIDEAPAIGLNHPDDVTNFHNRIVPRRVMANKRGAHESDCGPKVGASDPRIHVYLQFALPMMIAHQEDGRAEALIPAVGAVCENVRSSSGM